MTKPPDYLILLALRYEKAAAAFLRDVDRKDTAALIDSILVYSEVLKAIHDLPSVSEKLALDKFLSERGNVTKEIAARVLAEMDRVDQFIGGPAPTGKKH